MESTEIDYLAKSIPDLGLIKRIKISIAGKKSLLNSNKELKYFYQRKSNKKPEELKSFATNEIKVKDFLSYRRRQL